MKVYQYPKCSTCKKAIKFLDKKGVAYKSIDIVESPPTKTELKKMLRAQNGELKKLFNTSGVMYREMKLKDRLPSMTDSEGIELLAENGKLIKRPFALQGTAGVVGFREDEWKTLVKKG